MAALLTDHERSWAVDDQRLEEITLLARLMIEATGRSDPLALADIDDLLEHAPTLTHVTPQPGS
jgi:hypothetical protein